MSVKIGETAPDFTLPSDDGSEVTLSGFRGQKVILYFYPKAGTSGCTRQALGFRDVQEVLQGHNAVVLGVSPDPITALQKFRTKQALELRPAFRRKPRCFGGLRRLGRKEDVRKELLGHHPQSLRDRRDGQGHRCPDQGIAR